MDTLDLSHLSLQQVAGLAAVGKISEDELDREWSRRNSSGRRSVKPLRRAMGARRREPRSPDKVASQRRRRSIAGAGWLCFGVEL